MCELLAMSSRVPTSFALSMQRLASHGTPNGHLADGWGVACFDGNDVRVLREPEPAGESAWIQFIGGHPLRSQIMLAHIRHATQGSISLANTQPFVRSLGGRMHVFAHNGMLPGIERAFGTTCGHFRPVGTTDSERAFCALLEAMAPLWSDGSPEVVQRLEVVTRLAARLRALGPANFIYADGEFVFAHGHRRTQDDGQIAPPGLAVLQRSCAVDRDALPQAGIALERGPGPQLLTLFASVPLSGEAWRPLGEGEIVVVRGGDTVAVQQGASLQN